MYNKNHFTTRWIQIALAVFSVVLASEVGEINAASWGDKGFPIYPIQLSISGNPTNVIQLQAAGNEHLFLVFKIKDTPPQHLEVSLRARQNSRMSIAYDILQIRPVPAELDNKYFADGLVPLHSNLAIASSPLLVGVRIKTEPILKSDQEQYELIFRSGAQKAIQPLSLKFFKFSLPKDLPVTIMGLFWPNRNWFTKYSIDSEQEADEVFLSYLQSMRDYKINAVNTFNLPVSKVISGQSIENFPRFTNLLNLIINDLGYRYFRLPNFPNIKELRKSPDELREQALKYLLPMKAYLTPKRWGKRVLINLWDEPKEIDYPEVKKIYGIVKKIVPEFKTDCTGRVPNPAFAEIIDIWVTYGEDFNLKRINAAREKGQNIWLYANYVHGVRKPPLDQRIIGWYLYQYKLGGYLFWGLNFWAGEDPWIDPPGKADYFRRGTFYYPDPQTGRPIPTLRLESFRRGWEDYQYLTLLQKAVQEKRVPQHVMNSIKLKMITFSASPRTLYPKNVTWSQLENLRIEIGQWLSKTMN